MQVAAVCRIVASLFKRRLIAARPTWEFVPHIHCWTTSGCIHNSICTTAA
jgi:hypothetical protein